MTEKTQPTDAELRAWVQSLIADDDSVRTNDEHDHMNFARAVLAKWGTPAGAGEVVAWRIKGTTYRSDWLNGKPSDEQVEDVIGKVTGAVVEYAYAAPTATPQPTQAQAGAVPLTDARILELAGLAPDRKVCASTCMTAKFEKKPCECYPTSASRSEVVAIARAIEVAHGIKGADHG
jgi:hypothetical protein